MMGCQPHDRMVVHKTDRPNQYRYTLHGAALYVYYNTYNFIKIAF